ncbi:transglycosylase domain-containing protein [Vibrio chagasii]|nr:transglycosylase domain-containing protein [Vibrio chagasii]
MLCRVLQNGGESTITQQLARNFFLSNEKRSCVRLKRTIAIHIEQLLSKEEIMEPRKQDLLGHRSYGFLRRCSTRPTLVKIFRINLSELADPSRYASILQP